MSKEVSEILNNIKRQNKWNGIDYFKTPLRTEDADKLLNYIEQLQQENKELHNKIDKAIEVIHTQMKNNPSYKENLKIIENNLIKGSCKVCDLKDSDVDE